MLYPAVPIYKLGFHLRCSHHARAHRHCHLIGGRNLLLVNLCAFHFCDNPLKITIFLAVENEQRLKLVCVVLVHVSRPVSGAGRRFDFNAIRFLRCCRNDLFGMPLGRLTNLQGPGAEDIALILGRDAPFNGFLHDWCAVRAATLAGDAIGS